MGSTCCQLVAPACSLYVCNPCAVLLCPLHTLGPQVIGVLCIAVWVLGLMGLLFSALKAVGLLRISADEEHAGLVGAGRSGVLWVVGCGVCSTCHLHLMGSQQHGAEMVAVARAGGIPVQVRVSYRCADGGGGVGRRPRAAMRRCGACYVSVLYKQRYPCRPTAAVIGLQGQP